MLERTIILYGSGSPLIVEYEEICLQNNIEIVAVVKNLEETQEFLENTYPVLKPHQISHFKDTGFICPMFTPYNRYRAIQEAMLHGLVPFGLLNAPTNLLSRNFTHGKGCFLNKGLVCGAASVIGDFVLVNRGVVLGHHLLLEDYVSIGPGVVTGGNVTIQRGAMVGAGSIILPKIQIGRHAVIGAGSVVTKDVPDHGIVVGNPAREIKKSKIDF